MSTPQITIYYSFPAISFGLGKVKFYIKLPDEYADYGYIVHDATPIYADLIDAAYCKRDRSIRVTVEEGVKGEECESFRDLIARVAFLYPGKTVDFCPL